MLPWFPKNVSTYGGDIDALFMLVLGIVGFWFVLAQALIFFFIIRYRRRAGRAAQYLNGESLRQSAWVLVPAAIVLVLDLWIDSSGAKAWEKATTVPEGAMRIQGTAKQFNWIFLYPGPDAAFGTADDFEIQNQLHVPVDRAVNVFLTSKDVIHSFFLPNVRLKMDVMPGRQTNVWFEAMETGSYELACAELCGFGHYTMRGQLVVHAADEYQQWLVSQVSPPEEGEPTP